MLISAGVFQFVYLADFGLAGYIFIQSYSLSKLFAKAFHRNTELTYELDLHNKNLEITVQQRTAEINIQKEELIKQAEYLKETNILISEKNEELHQQNEEITAQKEEIEHQKMVLNSQHERIQSGIKYAGTIQNAILPLKSRIEKYFNTFILFKPKDVVSGDFYWYAHLPARYDLSEKFFFAVSDCTGHGVPGAFMSMIGTRLLSEIVNERKITSPNEILSELNNGIIKSLQQRKSGNHDGMDVCLCRLEPDLNNNEYILTFSGAKRPLYIYYSDKKEFERIPGVRKSIGGKETKNAEMYSNVVRNLKKGDILYLTTDGYADQNNSEREKFGILKFEILLKELSDKDFAIQEIMLEAMLTEHQGTESQRDDITVWVLKI
jgi:serine phosphatase RsbU (regulator of sigma subunit)